MSAVIAYDEWPRCSWTTLVCVPAAGCRVPEGVQVHALEAGPFQRPELVGFHCPVCGFVLPAEGIRPIRAPLCAGSKVRCGRQHAPTPMRPLVVPQAST